MAVTTKSDRANRSEEGGENQVTPRERQFYWRYVYRAQNTGHRIWDWANKRTNGFVAYLAQAFKNFTNKGTTEAVVFGYWAMFSLFPLVMLAVVVGTFALGPEGARAQVYSALNSFIP